jgi:uncharacterized protein RhaS with RHS repeats
MSDLRVQYLTDDEGNRTAALVNIDDWNAILQVYAETHFLEESIRRGFQDVDDVRNGKKEAVSLEDFLNEL